MIALGPFESHPHLAIAVSGGADSLALLLLAQDWVQKRDGHVTALTVDHGLRPEAAEEVRMVAALCADRGMEHMTLRWCRDPEDQRPVQVSARQGRYDLLLQTCRKISAFHLLVAHHWNDLQETWVQRLEDDSGLRGLAGISARRVQQGVQILRPLLGVTHEDLTGFLHEQGVAWAEDPSNQDARYRRVALRQRLQQPTFDELRQDMILVIPWFARLRAAFEPLLAEALNEGVRPLADSGALQVNMDVMMALPEGLRRSFLERVLCCVGGADYPPRTQALSRLLEAVQRTPGQGRSLAGCLLKGDSKNQLLVTREIRFCPDIPVFAGEEDWDNRFRLAIPKTVFEKASRIGPLGPQGWQELVRFNPRLKGHPWPMAVRIAVPAIRDLEGLLEVPHFDYRRQNWGSHQVLEKVRYKWSPHQTLLESTFTPDVRLRRLS